MTQATLKKKIRGLEAELELLKRVVVQKPEFAMDEVNWRKVRSEAKATGRKLYQRRYGKSDG
jgi:hypothetical protein